MLRLSIPCDVCSVRRPGFLWLGGGDWAECPQCVAGRVEVIREEFKPKGKCFIPGSTQGFTVLHPEHARIA